MSEEKKASFWNSMNGDIKFLMIILIGFMFLIFDQHIVCSWLNGIYPPFQQSSAINEEFQLFTMNYLFGMKANVYEKSIGEIAYNIKVDIFSDLIGYVLITIGLKKLSKRTKVFNIGVVTSLAAIVLYIITRLLPFLFNGEQLSYICFFLIIAQFGIEVCIGYMFIYGLCDLLSGYQYVRDRRAIVISWFATVVLNAVVMILAWMSWFLNPAFYTIYNMLDLAVNLIFFYFVFRNREYYFGYKKA